MIQHLEGLVGRLKDHLLADEAADEVCGVLMFAESYNDMQFDLQYSFWDVIDFLISSFISSAFVCSLVGTLCFDLSSFIVYLNEKQ